MTVDIHFGKYELVTEDGDHGDQYERADWSPEPEENDGTRPEFSIYSGHPRRSFPNVAFAEWTQRSPIAFAVAAVCWRDEQQVTRLDDGIMRLLNALPEKGETPIDRDRARWFKYWAARAREEFGADAVIRFW